MHERICMKVCVFGAGAVGSHIAAKLINTNGADVAIVARGDHLHSIRQHGLKFGDGQTEFTVAVPIATDDPFTLPPHDLTIVTLKASSIPACTTAFRHLTGESGSLLFLTNGLPWWWNIGLSPSPGHLPLLDPGGQLWERLSRGAVFGGVVYSSNEIVAPGHVLNSDPNHNRFVLGSPYTEVNSTLVDMASLLSNAGIPAETTGDIRRAIWRKLLVNASNGPLAALTRLTNGARLGIPDLPALERSLINEVAATALSMGWDIRKEAEEIAVKPVSETLKQARPSMLQDVLKDRPIEVDAFLGQLHVFARERLVSTPVLDVILPLLRGLDHSISSI